MAKIVEAAQDSNLSLWEVICHPSTNGLNVNRGTMAKLDAFRSMIETFMSDSHTADALALGKDIITKSGIEADLASDKTPEGDAKRENVDALVSGIASFVQEQQQSGNTDHVRLADYLSTVSLVSDVDSSNDSDDKVTLMTIHSAKGLEFNTVFVVGLEENIFPGMLSLDDDRKLEEERRLLYVAITRAERHCYLTWAHERWRYGKLERYSASRFIEDIDPKYLENKTDGSSYQRGRRSAWAQSLYGDDNGFPFDDDYEINKPYIGFHDWGKGNSRFSSRMQNSRPVAGQFMADPRPKETAPHRPEKAVNPFSESMERKLKSEGRWSRVQGAMTNGGRRPSSSASLNAEQRSNAVQSLDGNNKSQTSNLTPQILHVGNVIEHSRFGRGTVVKVEGTGENCKATVEFEHTGRKQLLLKFARFTIVG